jgi:hypothetical protein
MSDYDPGLDAIMRTDRFVDALASGARMSSVDPLSSMLGAWRDDVRSQPDAPVVTLAQASAALADAQKPVRRNRFGLTVVGAAAAAVLGLGGFGTVVYDANPGDTLYGLRTMLFGESAKTRDDAVVLAAQTELAQVQQLVQEGKWDQAQERLMTLGPTVQSVNDVQNKQQLVEQYNSLTAKVIQRNPEAPPPPPGEPPPVDPSSPLTFLQVPVVVAPTTTSPSISDVATTSVPTTVPTPTGPLPPSTVPLPTPTGPLPTGPLPTSPVPTGPLPTPTGPLPTPTAPQPTPTTPPTILRTTPPTILRTTPPTVTPTAPATVTIPPVPAPTSAPQTVTTPAAPPPTTPAALPTTKAAPPTTEAAPPSGPQTTRAPATQRPSVVVTTTEEAPDGPEKPGR